MKRSNFLLSGSPQKGTGNQFTNVFAVALFAIVIALTSTTTYAQTDHYLLTNDKGIFKSQFVYELREPARIDCTYLPRAGDVEAFFDVADVTSMTDHLEKVGEGLLAVKLGLTFGSLAHPVFAIAVIALEAGLEELVKNLQTDFRDRRATKQLWELVRKSPYQIKDIGGPGHTQFGDFIRRKEESGGAHLQKSFGGLSKWMNPETHTFAWVCPTDAYNLIAKYRSNPRLPGAGHAAA